MTQNWGPSNYPPRPPQYQPPAQPPVLYQPPEDYAEEPHGDSTGKRTLFFVAGGCATAMLFACCVLILVVAWAVDERYGITTPKDETPIAASVEQPFNEPAPVEPVAPIETDPNAPAGLPDPLQSTPEAAPVAVMPLIGEPVVAEDRGIELLVLDIQHDVQPSNLAAAQGMEFVAVSVQLRSAGPAQSSKLYEVSNFQMENAQGVVYVPDMQADNGRRLAGGELSEEASVEGDVLFHIPQGEGTLFLVWQPSGSEQSYTISLQ